MLLLATGPAGATAGDTWQTILSAVALVVSIGSLLVAYLSPKRQVESQMKMHREALKQDREQALLSRTHTSTIEEARLAQARKELQGRANISGMELEQAARKIVHDTKIEEAKLIHMYFDKLMSSDEKEQELALFSLSAFVDQGVMERLTRDARMISAASLSRLAVSSLSPLAVKAQETLNSCWKDVEPALVCISSGLGDERKTKGFALGRRYVVCPLIAKEGEDVSVQQSHSMLKSRSKCIAADSGHGIMLVDTRTQYSNVALTLGKSAVGGDKPVPITVAQISSNYRFQVTVGNATIGARKGILEVRAPAAGGSEGAPVFDEQGLVAGMMVSSQVLRRHGPVRGEIGVAVSADILAALVERASKHVEVHASPS